ncbi:MAG: hypothetical protein ACM34K_20355 [Bacillota bacterium]
MKKILSAVFVLLNVLSVFSQDLTIRELRGRVTYQTTQNTYVSFESTEFIKRNDTLFLKSSGENIPALLVQYLSSRSCAGPALGNLVLKPGDELYAFVPIVSIKDNPAIAKSSGSLSAMTQIHNSDSRISDNSGVQGTDLKTIASSSSIINGRFSVQSFSGFSNNSRNNYTQRWRYLLSSEIKNLLNSQINFSNYITFSYNVSEWDKTRNNLTKAIRLYDFSIQYDYNKSFHLWAGRYINQKISSLGAIDGVQIEKKWDSFYGGIAAGSRPDYSDFGINLKLFETGVYIGRYDTLQGGIISNNLAFFNQTNNFMTDRRFIYFQHDSYILKNISLFFSSEADLYSREKGSENNELSLTSLYFLSRFSPLSWLSVSFSYDARKNVIYYETFKNFADSLFDKETRQGIRAGISLRPLNNIYMGIDAGYRFEKKGAGASTNFSGYLSSSAVPILDISGTISTSRLKNMYLDGWTYGMDIRKDIFSSLLSFSAGYKSVNYTFAANNGKLQQHIFAADVSILLMNNIYLISSYEGIFEKSNNFGRLLLEVSSRF